MAKTSSHSHPLPADVQTVIASVVAEMNEALGKGAFFNPEMFGSMLRPGDNPILRWRDALLTASPSTTKAVRAVNCPDEGYCWSCGSRCFVQWGRCTGCDSDDVAKRPALVSPSPSPQGVIETDCIHAAVMEVEAELRRAMSLFGPFKNGHEGYAVILEEVDELWDEVKGNKHPEHVQRQRKEAIQIAAMALRFVVDLGSKESTR